MTALLVFTGATALTAPARAAWSPVARMTDANGPQSVAVIQNGGEPRAVAARTGDSTTVDPSPLGGPAYWTAAGSPTGRTLIAASTLIGTLRVATWTPVAR